jgi:hypothetical protein
VVVYYVIALALYMQSFYREVLRCLLEEMQWLLDPSSPAKVAAAAVVIPPPMRANFLDAVLDEILQERLAQRRNRRGVKRKISTFPIRRRGQQPPPSFNPVDAIKIIKRTVSRLG